MSKRELATPRSQHPRYLAWIFFLHQDELPASYMSTSLHLYEKKTLLLYKSEILPARKQTRFCALHEMLVPVNASPAQEKHLRAVQDKNVFSEHYQRCMTVKAKLSVHTQYKHLMLAQDESLACTNTAAHLGHTEISLFCNKQTKKQTNEQKQYVPSVH